MIKQSTFTLYYFIVGISFIILEQVHLHLAAVIVKAMIIPVLMLFYHTRAKSGYSAYHRLIMAGLFFSWLGDILLQINNNPVFPWSKEYNFFLFGLSAFLVTQVLYTLAFNIPRGKNYIFNRRIYQLLLIIAYGILLIWLLYNRLGDYKLPVLIYTFVILTMLATAANRYGKVNGLSYILVFIGALLFVVSDSLIAVNKFYEKFDFARIFIMATYISAQFLIAAGSLRQDFAREGKHL